MGDDKNQPARRTYHYILTMQKAIGSGHLVTTTDSNELTLAPGSTRAQVLAWAIQDTQSRNPQMAGANVLFFSLEPNQL